MTTIYEEFKKAASPHDAAFRHAFRKPDIAEAFFRHHLPEKVVRHLDFSTLELMNGSFVDEQFRQSHADLLYQAHFKGKPVLLYILFEHQSTSDPRMAFRILCYMVNIWKDYERNHPEEQALPLILPIVLYHGKRKWSAPLNFRDMLNGYNEDFQAYTPDFAYHLFDLNLVDENGLTASGNKVLAVALHMFKHIFDDVFGDLFMGTAELMIDMEDERHLLEILEWTVMYALRARNENAREIIDVVRGQSGKIGKENIRRVIMTAAEQLKQEGIEIGKLMGREEGKLMGREEGKLMGREEGKLMGREEGKLMGREEGKLMGREEGKLMGREEGIALGFQEALFKQVKKRFGQISPFLERRLRQSDLIGLERFGEAIFDFSSLEDAELWWRRFDS